MKTIIFRNPEKLGKDDVLNEFISSLKETESFTTSEIENLASIYAKNPTDRFIITEEFTCGTAQGDILINSEKSELYRDNFSRIKNLKKTDRLILQEGDSLTGDHRLIPLEGSNYTVQTGRFTPKFLEGKRRWGGDVEYSAIVFETDKPFLIFHREHGNVALPQGKYMFCSQLDPFTLDRMMD